MAFMINTCNRILALSHVDDRKLFEFASEGLNKEDKFHVKAENAQIFLELIGNNMEEIKLRELFKVSSWWNTSAIEPRVPKNHVNLFLSNVTEKEAVTKYCDLFCSDSSFGADAPLCFTNTMTAPFAAPKNTTTLNAARDYFKLKDITLEK